MELNALHFAGTKASDFTRHKPMGCYTVTIIRRA